MTLMKAFNLKKQKDHVCNLTNIDIQGSQITTISAQIKLEEEIINKYLDKSLIWHLDNLSKNNIILKRIQIKNILEKMIEFNYPKDENYLNENNLKIVLIFVSMEHLQVAQNIIISYII